MKSSTLIVLVVVTGVVGTVAAIMSSRGRATAKSEIAPEMLFPDLGKRINDVASVTLKKADKEFTFKRTETGWETADRGGFPAKVEKIKEALVSLSQLRMVEEKTSRPDNYATIGVEDPGTAKTPASTSPDEPAQTPGSTLMTLKDANGQTVSAVIIGNTKWDAKPGIYLRKAGEAQSWLAEGRVDLPTDFTGWVDTQFASIPRERVKKAELTFPDGTKTLVSREKKEDQNFTVHDVPAGEELLGANAGDAIGNAISYLSFEDVRPASEIDFAGTKGTEGGKPGPSSEFQTFDGMKILIQTYEQKVPAANGKPEQTKLWAHFVAAYDESLAPPPAPPTPEVKPGETPPPTPPTPPAADKKPEEVQKEVADFNAKTAKWAFQLPDYKATGFKTTIASMLKGKTPTPPASLNEGNTAAPLSPMPLPLPPQNPPPAAPSGAPPAATPPPVTPAPQPESKPESPVKPPENPPQPAPAPTGGG